jgi:glycosyltransferase involved in cell wall biosynthesis
VRSVWADAHIAVLPSRGGEGVPMTLMEAAACGRPLVATDVPGCRDIARPGVTGLLVPPDDPAALADAIERLARDPDLRRRFATAGRQLVEETFASRRVGQDIVAIYRDVAQWQAARCGGRGTGG